MVHSFCWSWQSHLCIPGALVVYLWWSLWSRQSCVYLFVCISGSCVVISKFTITWCCLCICFGIFADLSRFCVYESKGIRQPTPSLPTFPSTHSYFPPLPLPNSAAGSGKCILNYIWNAFCYINFYMRNWSPIAALHLLLVLVGATSFKKACMVSNWIRIKLGRIVPQMNTRSMLKLQDDIARWCFHSATIGCYVSWSDRGHYTFFFKFASLLDIFCAACLHGLVVVNRYVEVKVINGSVWKKHSADCYVMVVTGVCTVEVLISNCSVVYKHFDCNSVHLFDLMRMKKNWQ